jgi:hypothetical protein
MSKDFKASKGDNLAGIPPAPLSPAQPPLELIRTYWELLGPIKGNIFMRERTSDFLAGLNVALGWHRHPRNGKIARLPEPIRNLINQMLDDALPYRTIREKLRCLTPPLPYAISDMNISNWYHGGYQDWRKQQMLNDVPKQASPSPQPTNASVSPQYGNRATLHSNLW